MKYLVDVFIAVFVALAVHIAIGLYAGDFNIESWTLSLIILRFVLSVLVAFLSLIFGRKLARKLSNK